MNDSLHSQEGRKYKSTSICLQEPCKVRIVSHYVCPLQNVTQKVNIYLTYFKYIVCMCYLFKSSIVSFKLCHIIFVFLKGLASMLYKISDCGNGHN